jgi:hypothetical protein
MGLLGIGDIGAGLQGDPTYPAPHHHGLVESASSRLDCMYRRVVSGRPFSVLRLLYRAYGSEPRRRTMPPTLQRCRLLLFGGRLNNFQPLAQVGGEEDLERRVA